MKVSEDGIEDIPTPDFMTDMTKGFFPAMVKFVDNIKDEKGLKGKENELPEEDIVLLFKKMLGGSMKILYGAIWQVLVLISIITCKNIN